MSRGFHVFLPAIILFSLLIFILLSSCASDKTADGDSATVCLRLKVSDSPVTRSLSSTNENTINNITVLIFDSSSQLIGSKYVDGLSSSTDVTATVTTRAASGCTVYAIANAGDASSFSGVNTIAELNEKCSTLSGVTALGDATSTIMEGSTPDVTISTGTNNIKVAMKHLCSKVNVSIIPSGNITVTGYRLCNAPLGSYITDSHSSAGTAVTPPTNNSGDRYGDFDAVTLSSPSAGTTVTIPAYYVYENLAGSSSALTSDLERTSAKAPTNAMYLLVYARTSSWHSTYRIYLGGMTNASPPATDYSNFNVYRNRNYSYTVNINGSGQSDARVSYMAQYLFSDGTWGSYDADKIVIGIIFSNTTSSTDKSHGWTHGYAMALQNAGSATATYQWYTSASDNPTGTNLTTADQIMSDKDGYTHSGYIQMSGYAAGIAAKGYTAKDKNGNVVVAPSGTSGWYLPSIGQWYDICVDLGGMVAVSGKAYTNSGTGWLQWYGRDDNSNKNYPSLCASAINVYLNALKDKGYSVSLFSNNNEYYWSSSEYHNVCASYVGFCGDMGLGFSNKTSLYRVRPVIAF